MNRSRIEIMVGMLKKAAEDPERGEVKSRIMGGNGMSHPQLGKYLGFMLGQELLEPLCDGRYTRYRPTEKGYKLIHDFNSLKELLKKD